MSKFLQWLSRVRFPERAILITLLLIGSSVWAFIEIADEVQEGGSKRFDEWVLRALRQPDDLGKPVGPLWLADAARDVTALGSVVVISMVTLAALGLLALQRKPHAAILLAAAVIGGSILGSLLKEAFDRDRPSVVPHLARVTSLSFPSGHSMLSAVMYLTLGAILARTTKDRAAKVYYLTLAVALALVIGLSRIYLGVHFPTDVLAGWCAGVAWALLCATVAQWLQRRGQVEEGAVPAKTEPGAPPGAAKPL